MEFPRPINRGDPNYLLSGMILQGAETWPTNQPSPKPTPSDGWNPGSTICLHSKNETKRKLVEQKGMKQDVGDVYAKNTLESNDRKFKHYQKNYYLRFEKGVRFSIVRFWTASPSLTRILGRNPAPARVHQRLWEMKCILCIKSCAICFRIGAYIVHQPYSTG